MSGGKRTEKTKAFGNFKKWKTGIGETKKWGVKAIIGKGGADINLAEMLETSILYLCNPSFVLKLVEPEPLLQLEGMRSQTPRELLHGVTGAWSMEMK